MAEDDEVPTTEIKESMNWKGAAFFVCLIGSVLIWLFALVDTQRIIGDAAGGGVFPGGVALIIAFFVLVTSLFYYLKKGIGLWGKLRGLGLSVLVSAVAYGLLTIPWSSIFAYRIIVTLIFVLLGLFCVLMVLADLNISFSKIRWFDLPVNIFRWDGAGYWDLGIGFGLALVFLVMSFWGGTSFIGVPIDFVPAGLSGVFSGAFFTASVAMIENTVLVMLPIGLVSSVSGFLAHRRTGDVERSRWVGVVAGVLVSVFVVFPLAWLFHSAVYGSQSFSLVYLGLFFALMGVVTVVRGNSLAMDVFHALYNFGIVLLGLVSASVVLI